MSLMNGNSLLLKQKSQDVCVICIERSGIVNSTCSSVWLRGRSTISDFLCVNHAHSQNLVSVFHWILFIFLQESELIARLEERLALVSDGARRGLRSDVVCDVCHTPVTRLKQEAIAMVQSLERAQADSPIPASHIPTYLGGSKSVAARSMPRTTPHYSSTHHRYVQFKYFRVAILRQWRIGEREREPYPHSCKNKLSRKWLLKISCSPPSSLPSFWNSHCAIKYS